MFFLDLPNGYRILTFEKVQQEEKSYKPFQGNILKSVFVSASLWQKEQEEVNE